MNINVNNSNLLQVVNVAFICDAENVSYKYMSTAIKIARRIGNIETAEAFGCWSCENNKKWKKTAEENNLQMVDVKRVIVGVDTVDKSVSFRLCTLSNTPDVHAIVLVSSDSGYVDIITTMKKNGNILVGVGEDKTPAKYRNEFDVFYNLTTGFYETKIQIIHDLKTTCALVYMLREACFETSDLEEWSQLAAIGHYLKTHYESWQESAVGFSLLSLITFLDLFEVHRTENENILVREQ